MNKLTLIVDGNWLLMSRLFTLQEWFSNLNSTSEKEEGKQMLKEQMVRSINLIINQFKCIDNIVFVADGGSWRKKLERPISIKDDYKGTRHQDSDYDWSAIYGAVHELVESFKFSGLTASCSTDIEGDDWIAYWSERLNKEGVNCLIWSTDADLKQLVKNNANSFTAWYNKKSGLVLHEAFNIEKRNFFDDILNPNKLDVSDALKRSAEKVTYIDPNDIVISKIISGDKSDNIKAVATVVKNDKNYGITEREFDKVKTNLKMSVDIDIKNVDDLFNNIEEVAERICKLKKYADANTVEDVIERIKFNRVLVELKTEHMPNELQAVCEAEEYNEYDINYFKNNYTVLLGESGAVSSNAPSKSEIVHMIDDLPF